MKKWKTISLIFYHMLGLKQKHQNNRMEGMLVKMVHCELRPISRLLPISLEHKKIPVCRGAPMCAPTEEYHLTI